MAWLGFLLWGSWSRSLYPFRGESTIPHHTAASYVLFKTAFFHPFPLHKTVKRMTSFLPPSCGGRFFVRALGTTFGAYCCVMA